MEINSSKWKFLNSYGYGYVLDLDPEVRSLCPLQGRAGALLAIAIKSPKEGFNCFYGCGRGANRCDKRIMLINEDEIYPVQYQVTEGWMSQTKGYVAGKIRFRMANEVTYFNCCDACCKGNKDAIKSIIGNKVYVKGGAIAF